MSVIAAPTSSTAGTGPERIEPDGGSTMTRRRVLQLAAASVLGITLEACTRSSGRNQSQSEDPTAFWRVIAQAAQKQDLKLSLRGAETELAAVGGTGTLRHPSTSQRRGLQQRITADFADGKTMLVQGWLLARTEVLAAIVIVGIDR